jgi:hypothetical protein
MKDAILITTKALPAAAATNSHDGIDIGARSGTFGIVPDGVELEISWPALPALVEAKTVTFTVNDSADNSSFASLGLTKVLTGGAGNGHAAGSVKFKLPDSTRRYVNVSQAVLTAGGDNTGVSTTVSIIART